MNQHLVDITIVWCDDRWHQPHEQDYIENCLQAVLDEFKARPIQPKEERRSLFNIFGRQFAEIHISPANPIRHYTLSK